MYIHGAKNLSDLPWKIWPNYATINLGIAYLLNIKTILLLATYVNHVPKLRSMGATTLALNGKPKYYPLITPPIEESSTMTC